MLRILREDKQRDVKVRTATSLAAMLKTFDIKGWRLPRNLRCNEPLNSKGCVQ